MTSSREVNSQEITPTRRCSRHGDANVLHGTNSPILYQKNGEQRPWRFLLLLPHALCLMAAAALLINTPTLNFDDLQIAEWAPDALSQGWSRALATVLFNLDLGVWQPRTYGLARAIQYVEGGLFGSAPAPAYLFIVLVHFGSGALVYQIVKKAGGDTLTGIFAAVAWMASPAVLSMLKVQHYFLYLIAPYYPLLGWLLLSSAREQSARTFWIGASLLTAAWLLGEGVTIPIVVVVVASAMLRGSWRRAAPLIAQGAVAALLLFFYLGYQHFFIRDPSMAQRFRIAPDLGLLEPFLLQLWQNGRAVVGLSHYDSELGNTLGGIGVFEGAVFWVISAVLVSFGVAAVRLIPCTSVSREPGLGVLVVLAWLSSLGLYVLFMVAGMGPFPPRYAAAFFVLMPVAIIVGLWVYTSTMTARLGAAMIASLSVALTLTSLYRAEVLVSKPNRVLLNELHGRAVVLRPDSEFNVQDSAIPGLVPISGNGLANPMRSLWTAELALKHYAGATLGNTCQRVSHDKTELFSLGKSKGVYPSGDFVVAGSTLTPEQACRTLRDNVSQPALAAGLQVMQGRVLRKVDAYTEIVPTAASRYFIHPEMEKDAVMEFDISNLSSLTLSPRISELKGDCLGDAEAGVVEISYAVDDKKPTRILVDQDYDELVVVDVARSNKMTIVVNQGNDVITCDWFELGFLDVRAR